MMSEEIDQLIVMSKLSGKPLQFMVYPSYAFDDVRTFYFDSLTGITHQCWPPHAWAGRTGWSKEDMLILFTYGKVLMVDNVNYLMFKGFVDEY